MPQYGQYKYQGMGGINADPYTMGGQPPAYRENSQGGQGSIGSSGSGINKGGALGSRGSDFKLPQVTNKMAMGGMKNLPGMPGSKGGVPS